MIKVIIAGSRKITDYALIKDKLNAILANQLPDIEIVSGGASGVDSLGERYAKEYGLVLQIFKAEWNKYGKSAGFKRNILMAQYGTYLIAFWDGLSKGTKHMIETAKDNGLIVRIVLVEK